MIRNGFVSNSSSSSFVLTYHKDKVITGGDNIVEFLRENPYEKVILKGKELSDGLDIFELSDSFKSDILKYPERFIANTKNIERWGTDYRLRVEPAIAYFGTEANLYSMQVDCLGLSGNLSEEESKSAIKSSLAENCLMEDVFIDYSATEEDSWGEDDFRERYIIGNDLYTYEALSELRDVKPFKERGFILRYKEDITDKTEIIRYIEESNELMGLCWKPDYRKKVLNEDIEIFRLNKKEKDYILEHKDIFLESNSNFNLLIDYDIIYNAIKISDDGYYYEARYGNVIDIKRDFLDFEKFLGFYC